MLPTNAHSVYWTWYCIGGNVQTYFDISKSFFSISPNSLPKQADDFVAFLYTKITFQLSRDFTVTLILFFIHRQYMNRRGGFNRPLDYVN